jgi:hypothetical protein
MTVATSSAAAMVGGGEEIPSPTTLSPSTIQDEAITSNATSPSRKSNCCSCFPLRYYAAIPIVFSSFGWFLRLTWGGCGFARLTGPIVAELTNDPTVPFIDVGFHQYRVPSQFDDDIWFDDDEWFINYVDACQSYNTDIVDVDGVWIFATISRYVSYVLGGAVTIFLWFSCCFSYSKATWRCAGYMLLLATVMLLLTFSWFGTSMCHGDGNKCTLSWDSEAEQITLISWAVATIFMFAPFPGPRQAVSNMPPNAAHQFQ